ncbi:FMN-binding protein [bacterium]|nr:FMN-binding protein [bacterium]
MGNFFRLVATLTIIAALASFGLSAVYSATHEITEEYKRQAEANARIEALACRPDATFEHSVTECLLDGRAFEYSTAFEDGEKIGYSFKAFGKGYSSTIETIVGVDLNGTICGVKITYQQETPGLGAKVTEIASQNTLWDVVGGSAVDETWMKPWFQTQFKGLRAGELVVVKNATEDGIVAITGATISSDAVNDSVKRGLELLMSIVDGTGDVPCEAVDAAGVDDSSDADAGEAAGAASDATSTDDDSGADAAGEGGDR